MAIELPTFEFDEVVDYEKVGESCDWMCLPEYFREALPEFMRQLTAGGYALVKLPEMEVDDLDMIGWRVGGSSEGRPRVQIEDDGRISIISVPNPFRSAEQAASLAAALIAAAQHVSEGRGQ